MLYALIVGCEAAFWVALVTGLALRYIWHQRRLSSLCLLCVPLIDVALLAFTVLDLRGGTRATLAHGLATAYVGFTVAFGPIMIRWADQRFAHRFAGGPPPAMPPSRGWAAVRYELKLWARCLVAVAITDLLLLAVIAFVARPDATRALEAWYVLPWGMAFFWFLFGPLWSLVFFKREKTGTGLLLRRLREADEAEFLAAHRATSPGYPSFLHYYHEGMPFGRYLEVLAEQEQGVNLSPEHVPATFLFAFAGQRIVGRASIRHTLSAPLLRFGGHIGYVVVPEFRRRGYATEILRLALQLARAELGLERVLVTCDDDNAGSIRTIEKNGGVLEDVATGPDLKKPNRRYWIDNQGSA